MDTLTSAFTTHQHLKALAELKKDQAFSIKVNFYAQVFFTIATWIIYLLFGAAMYAAPLWVLQTFFSSNSGNVLAILVLGVFLIVFPTALALGKHAGYHALSKRGVDIRYIGLIVAFFIASGVYFEMTSASSQQQEKANHAVETSNAGKSIMGTQVSNAASTGYAELIANAQLKYDRCLVKLKEGKERHCDGDKGKLTSLKDQANLEREAVNTANVAAITVKQEALQKERDAHALPIAKMFQELFSSTIATGAVIAAFVAALIFEISHALTIYNEFRLSDERTQLNKLVTETETRYFSETGKQYDGSDFRESEILDLAEMRKAGKVQHFNDRLSDVPEYHEPAFKEKTAFGFVPANRLSLDEENRKKYPQQIIWPKNDRPTPDDYHLVPRRDLQNAPQTSVVTDTANIQTSVLQTSVDAYGKAESASAGTVINCPNCGKSFKKVNRFHIFCSHSRNKRDDGGNCSDEYHNKLNPERAEVLKARNRRRKA